jgi:hypothetical protein
MAKGGRPRKYQSAAELQEKIDAYFAECDKQDRPYTVTGLARACGLDREQLINYAAIDEFSDAIKNAKAKVLQWIEERLNDKNTFTPGLIFNLKSNYGWRDEKKIEHSGNITIGLADRIRTARERLGEGTDD